VGGLAATRSSQEQPRRAQESQGSSGAAQGDPRFTQNTSTMTLSLGRLVVMVGLLSGALWWEGWSPPEAASSSLEQS